ncbi:TonB-dependent receptor [Thermophagus sp. OGC60D27]|uniref:TonB-dependent receptor n=1 Tax=Thermophagus sp. OGC60D27 TaxID=3458415 RepID=UPI0040383F09
MKKHRKGVASGYNKLLKIMKLTLLFITISIGQVLALSTYAQDTKINLKMEKSSLKVILDKIESETDYHFFYKSEDLQNEKSFDINFQDATIFEILDVLLSKMDLSYRVFDKYIAISTYKSDTLQSGQNKTINGTVTDNTGLPIPGVSVAIKGTTMGAITDVNGNFSLNIPQDAETLVFSFIGMKTMEVSLGQKTSFQIVMSEEIIGLDEVVAVGYGIKKKVNVIGAVSSLEGEELTGRPVAQTSVALQGLAPGVTVTQSSGQPGNDAGAIRIRGVGTLNNNDPLVLVDGMEYNINDIDVNDIESISVLKDAAASSIYGVRAANGVILITTQRGKDKEIKVSYNGYSGVQRPTQLPDFVGAQEYMSLVNLLHINSGGAAIFSGAEIAAYDNPNRNTDLYPDVKWIDEILQGSGFQQQHSVSISGGSDNAKYRFSSNYLQQKGLIKKANYERLTVRLNSDVNFNDHFTFQADLAAKLSDRTEPQGDAGGIWFQFNQAIKSNPTLPVNYSDGTWGISRGDGNPVRLQEEGGNYDYKEDAFDGNFKLKYELLDGLNIEGNAMVRYGLSFNSLYEKSLAYTDFFSKTEVIKGTDKIVKQNYKTLHTNLQGLLSYDKQLGIHSLGVLAGISRVNDDTDYLSALRNNGSLDVIDELAAGTPSSQENDGYSYGYSLLSYFGRLNYSLDNKYLFEANIRRDGSSRFSENNRWGVFPSFSVGWRITQESFMNNVDFIDDLKVRASWGELGNQEIGYYPYQSVMQLGYNYPFGSQLTSGARMIDAANSEISWERTQITNFGIDAILLRGKIDFAFEYYVKDTKDILIEIPIPSTVGQNAPYQNAGSVENKGWELALGYKGKIEDFKYEIQFNLSDVKNKITDLKDSNWEDQDNDNRILAYHEGYPIGAFYGYIAEGIFQSQQEIDNHAQQPGTIAPGDLMYKNISGDDDQINAEDRTIIGSSIPRYTYGLNFSAAYKQFDFSAFLQGVGKVDVNTVQSNRPPISQDGNFKEIHNDSWTETNKEASFPRLSSYGHNYVSSSFWIESGAYLRLKNMQLGYTLPETLSNKVGISRCRLYLGGQNLLTWSKLNDYGIDPENPQDSRYYPQVKVYTIGVNIDF